MKILFYGDSITDMGRERNTDENAIKYGLCMGAGYAHLIAAELSYQTPGKYQFINGGIGGNRSVDLYARIKSDCWNYTPDVISILIGINDVYPKEFEGNGVELNRFEKVYRLLIEDTKAKLPNVKLILCEPFMLPDSAYPWDLLKWDEKAGVRAYAKAVKKLAEEYRLPFVSLQNKLLQKAAEHGAAYYLYDGIHPTPAGAKLIAEAWLKTFNSLAE